MSKRFEISIDADVPYLLAYVEPDQQTGEIVWRMTLPDGETVCSGRSQPVVGTLMLPVVLRPTPAP
jgi:hypothetical protein